MTDVKTLLQRFKQVRARGYAVSDQENVPGLCVLGRADSRCRRIAGGRTERSPLPRFACQLRHSKRPASPRYSMPLCNCRAGLNATGGFAPPFDSQLTPSPTLETALMRTMTNFHGIIPAIAVPFRPDYGIDEIELRRFAAWLAKRKGVIGLMTNGHTGEVFSLTTRERAEVTRITADAVKDICPVISSVVCEGISEAIDHANMAKEAGAAALDIMPPHHWLRFGFKPEHCLDYFTAIGNATGLPLIVHVYPAWTRASFSSDLLAELAKLPHVRAFKIGTRDMNKYAPRPQGHSAGSHPTRRC